MIDFFNYLFPGKRLGAISQKLGNWNFAIVTCSNKKRFFLFFCACWHHFGQCKHHGRHTNIMGGNGKIPNFQFLTYRPQAFSGEQIIEKMYLFSWKSRLGGPGEKNGINKKWILGHFTQVKLYFLFLTCQYKKCVSVPPWVQVWIKWETHTKLVK